MAATLFFSFLSSNPPFSSENQSKLHQSMFIFIFFCSFTLSILSLSVLILALYRRHKKTEQKRLNSITRCPLPETVNKDPQIHESDLTQLTNSLLLEILPSNSPKWVNLFGGEGCEYPASNGSGLEREGTNSGEEECGKKKKKKRAKKKRANSSDSNAGEGAGEGRQTKEKQELVCLYPFTSSSSATQRKIKQQYDQLVKSHEKNGLTLAQVGQFVNCLVEARTELQHKSEAIQRKFTITKALLFKADRSSFDRIRQQIYKLELEQKRLEEDAFVYNWLQQQLKLSPAYKKMVEIGECMELNSKSDELAEDEQTEFSDISFEELLAQEKKDSFWQRNGKPRTVSE